MKIDPVRTAVVRAAAQRIAYLHAADEVVAADHAEARLRGAPRCTIADMEAPHLVDAEWGQIVEKILPVCITGEAPDPAEWAANFDGDLEMSAGAAVAGAVAWIGD